MLNETVGRYMLKSARQFIIQHKDIFKLAIIAFAKALPEPVIGEPQNKNERIVVWNNSPVFMEIFDKMMSYLKFEQDLYGAAAKIFVDEVEHDPDHRAIIMFLIEECVEATLDGRLKPRDGIYPSERLWSEPKETKGNFNGRNFKKLIKKEGE